MPQPSPRPSFSPIPQQPIAPPPSQLPSQPFAPPTHMPGQAVHPQYGAPPNPLDTPPKPAAQWKRFVAPAAIILVIIFGGWLGFISLHKNKATLANDGFASSKLTSYQVDGSGLAYSVNFFPGAKTSDKNNIEYLIATNSANKQFSVWLVKSSSKTSCVGTTEVTMTINGRTTTVCQGPSNAVYAADITLDSGLYQINLTGQQSIPLATAKSIIQSLNF